VEKTHSQRSVPAFEAVVWVLGISVILAAGFVIFAFVFRLRMGSNPVSASNLTAVSVQGSAPAAVTLMSTLTPTPRSTFGTGSQTTASESVTTAEPRLSPIPLATDGRLPADSPPTRLVIPSISLDIPVKSVGVKTVNKGGKARLVWDDVARAGGFHETSALPGSVGNTVINGHRDTQGSVFRKLDRVEAGDEITVFVGDVAYSYVVSETLVLPDTFASAEQRAENLRYIGHYPEERLTLVTCTPIGLATHRLLVIAVPPDQLLPQMPEAGADKEP
jgi:LPXTG-site transpeptidase (sortase) family protein